MKIGFIGCGNMGGSILDGILDKGIVSENDVVVSEKSETAIKRLSDKKIKVVSNKEVAFESDMIFLCVKPNVISEVLEEIKDLCKGKTVVSIAAGIQISTYESIIGKNEAIVRVMPNTPALVGEGMCGICSNEGGKENAKKVKDLLSAVGKAVIVTETLMDTVTAVSGSSPAMVFMLLEAMADAGVQGGMTRKDAYTFAAQCVLGSAKMVLETGKHPGELKDMVCSPKGTTIDMVASLEKNGFRNCVVEALKVCREKSENMR